MDSAVGQAFLKHRNETAMQKTPSPGPLSVWPCPVGDFINNSDHEETVGLLRRTRSSDVYWSGVVRTNETPAHLLGMTPNPDFTLEPQPPDRRHIRSLSVGDAPMYPHHHHTLPSTPSPPPPALDNLEDLSLCNIDDIMHGI